MRERESEREGQVDRECEHAREGKRERVGESEREEHKFKVYLQGNGWRTKQCRRKQGRARKMETQDSSSTCWDTPCVNGSDGEPPPPSPCPPPPDIEVALSLGETLGGGGGKISRSQD